MTMAASLGTVLAEGRASLRAASIDSASLDARLLACHSFGMSVEALIRDEDKPAPADRLRCYADSLARRARGEPVAYITGRREFWSLDFEVEPGCLVPRPDSEAIVSAILDAVRARTDKLCILDLGTGTGCLLLALLSELPFARGVGVDGDRHAIRIAYGNAGRLGLAGRTDFVQGDWASALVGPFDVIVANPPYIPSADIADLPRDVREYEPRAALDGGADGLEAIRTLMVQIGGLLAPTGLAALEFGPGQAGPVQQLARAARGLHKRSLICDLAGRKRGILLFRQGR